MGELAILISSLVFFFFFGRLCLQISLAIQFGSFSLAARGQNMLQQVAFVQFFFQRNYTQMNLFHTLECMDYCSIVVTAWVEHRIRIYYRGGG